MNQPSPLFELEQDTGRVKLYSPTAMPKAAGFLWNSQMMLQMNCRGFAVAQHMQPEPAKYSRGPSLEATTFMQPEHHYYACHPGRFFYLKDEQGQLFSLPHEPIRKGAESFEFIHCQQSIGWRICQAGLQCTLTLSLLGNEAAEKWTLTFKNPSDNPRSLQLTAYFSIGFMSWMNQSATFDPELNAILADSVTPYQKTEDYAKQSHFKDMTFLVSEHRPDSWLADQRAFEGEGGLAAPDALAQDSLPELAAHYCQPAGIMQYDLVLAAGGSKSFNWLFGPAQNRTQVVQLKSKFIDSLAPAAHKSILDDQQPILKSCIQIDCPDSSFSHFVNHWLPRQVRYHGESNRLTTDPQTRNLLQDSLGILYIDADKAKQTFLLALSQQLSSGAMPDGILLHQDAALKYINQIPHSDHNVWLTIFLAAYLRETNDVSILDHQIGFKDSDTEQTVFSHMQLAMQHLLDNLDHRDLSYIHQGDWCDPMNMVGYKGKGVSAWLTMATAYVFGLWSNICHRAGDVAASATWQDHKDKLNAAINQHFWTGQWYARGRTDEDKLFGCPADEEGRIFLNAQSWAILSDAARKQELQQILSQVDEQLNTPFGCMLLAPAYTRMREDIGRLTQKYPGTAENGSVYNHACAYYAYSLYQIGEADRAFECLSKMLVNSEQASIRGQMPVFIPNYYRGAYFQYPESAGVSSQLFNTGTVAWYYLCVIEGLFGLKGERGDLVIQPNLPSHWRHASVTRMFLGASFRVSYRRTGHATEPRIWVDSTPLMGNRISRVNAGQQYDVAVELPEVGLSKLEA